MPIPDYQSLMLPFLKIGADGREHSLREAIDAIATVIGLSPIEREELLPSGRQSIFDNRVGWARTYLKKAGMIVSTKRGHFQITKRGKDVVESGVPSIDNRFLEQYPEFREFMEAGRGEFEAPALERQSSVATPEEQLQEAYSSIRSSLASELLHAIKNCSPDFFERLVVDVVVAMGYGGSRKDAGQAVGKSGDGGIDGIIKEDRLGLDIIYLQAKRWEGTVGRPDVQKFCGALDGHHARKGIFITTSAYTKEASDCVTRIDKKIILIDGPTLAGMMIDCGVGVATFESFEIKRIDGDYFQDQ